MGRQVLLRQHRTQDGTVDYNIGHIEVRRLVLSHLGRYLSNGIIDHTT